MDFSTFDLMPLCVSVVVIVLLQGSLYPGVGSPREVFPQGVFDTSNNLRLLDCRAP